MLEKSKLNSQLQIAVPKEKRLSGVFNELAAYGNLRVVQDNPRVDSGVLVDTYEPYDPSLGQGLDDYLKRTQMSDVEVVYEKQSDMFNSLEFFGTDAAIMGSDKMLERQLADPNRSLAPKFKVTARFKDAFGMNPARLAICGETVIQSPQELNGQRIATSYPNVLEAWLADNKIEGALPIPKGSSVEDMIRRGAADYICDVVQSGDTLKAYGYTPLFDVARVYPVLVESMVRPVKQDMIDLRNRLKLAQKPMGGLPKLADMAYTA